MTIQLEESVDELTLQTTNLLDTCTSLKDDTALLISEAVETSENGAVEPLLQMATNLIGTQTLLITLITGSNT
jgi:hypothetical protein